MHSLGNFIFDMDFQTKTREGVFLEVVLWGGEVKAIEPVPYVIDDQFRPRLVTGSRADGILDDVWGTSRARGGSLSRPPAMPFPAMWRRRSRNRVGTLAVAT